MSKWMYVLGAVLMAGFAALGVSEMMKAQTPYVTSVTELRAVAGRPVQFMGVIVKGKASYDEDADELLFSLKDDKGDTIAVRHKGIKPANFDNADSAVVRGKLIGKEIVADQVLLKCPSKYKGK